MNKLEEGGWSVSEYSSDIKREGPEQSDPKTKQLSEKNVEEFGEKSTKVSDNLTG